MPDEEASSNPLDTAPVKRLRWATQRITGAQGKKKRQSIFRRLSHRNRPDSTSTNGEEHTKRDSAATDLGPSPDDDDDAQSDTQPQPGRRIFFNQPLPPDARDEEGQPVAQYVRNKIRTAKYTPISFIPKNIWFQFHNIANVYFLFIIILSVRRLTLVLPPSTLYAHSLCSLLIHPPCSLPLCTLDSSSLLPSLLPPLTSSPSFHPFSS